MIYNYQYDPTKWKRLEKKVKEKQKKRIQSKTGGIMTYEEFMYNTGVDERLVDNASKRIAYSLYYLTTKATNTSYDYEMYGTKPEQESGGICRGGISASDQRTGYLCLCDPDNRGRIDQPDAGRNRGIGGGAHRTHRQAGQNPVCEWTSEDTFRQNYAPYSPKSSRRRNRNAGRYLNPTRSPCGG